MLQLSRKCPYSEEDGSPEEHFFEIVHLKQGNAERIYSALVESLKEKQLQVSRIIGMGFKSAKTFSGKQTGVQTRIKKLAPHSLCTTTITCYSEFHQWN